MARVGCRVDVDSAPHVLAGVRRRGQARQARCAGGVAERVLVLEEAQRARAARSLEHGAQVARHRGFDDEALVLRRVVELEANAVQERAIERVLLLEEAVGGRVAVAIVAEDRVADGREMAADLVGAPLLGDDAQHGVAARDSEAAVAGACRIHLSVFAQLARDRALARRHAPRACDVDFARRLGAEHACHRSAMSALPREHHEAARADVDAVDGHGLARARAACARARASDDAYSLCGVVGSCAPLSTMRISSSS